MTHAKVGEAGGKPSFLQERKGLASWLFTTDHKRIGLLYLFGLLIFFVVGALFALLLRLELLFPGVQFMAGDLYNRVLTLHGVVMIFLFILPGLPAVFGNFFLPIMIGARDVSFPRLNLLSWYCYLVGGLLALVTVVFGGVDTGWTFYVPLVTQTETNIYFPLLAAFILGWSSILTGLNFITTVHRLRAPGMGWFKMPLFAWSLYATGWIQLIATPVVGITLVLVMLERALGIPIFDPSRGGDPILYEHLFWIYSHPAVYVMILPAMGAVSEIIPTFSRRTIFGYKFIAYSSLAIAGIGSLVWAHHMFTSGMADVARIVFSFLTFLVAVPSGVKVFNWLATMYRGSIALDPPMIYTLTFIFTFSVGGLTGMFLGALGTDIHVHDTAFVVAHFHYTMFGGTAVVFFAALHYWWPKMFGRMYGQKTSIFAAAQFFIGFNLTYIPLFIAGFLGMPRRYYDYLPQYTIYHQLSTIGSWILVSAILLMFWNLLRSLWRGKPARANPWGGRTLEWQILSPPSTENFSEIPQITHGPYDYPAEVTDD